MEEKIPVTRLPALGTLHRLQRAPLGLMREIYARPPGVFLAELLGRKYLLVSDPDVARTVLVDNERNYRKNYGAFLSAVGRSSLVTRGDEWRTLRQLNQQAFRAELLEAIAHSNRPLIDAFAVQLTGRGPVNINRAVGALMLDLTANGMFARRPTQSSLSIFEDIDCFLPIMDRCALSVTAMGRWLARQSNRQYTAALTRWRDLPNQIMRQAPARPDPGLLYDTLLASRNSANGISEQRLRDEILLFLAAGSQTSAAAISFALYLLWLYPNIQEAARAELRNAASPDPQGNQARKSPLLSAIIAETLRLYPPVWAVSRVATGRDVLAGIDLRANDVVIISYFGLHRSPHYWPCPDQFDPSRFAANAPKPRSHVYLPFGAGPRACIGAQLATAQAIAILGAILSRFRFEFLTPRAEPIDRHLRAGISLWPKQPLYVQFEAIESELPTVV